MTAKVLYSAVGLAISLATFPVHAGGGHEGCACGKSHWMQPGTRFDEATGRDGRVFPPSPAADFQHMKLELLIEDMNTPRISAVQKLAFNPVGTEMKTLSLDARGLAISAVSIEGRNVSFSHASDKLTIQIEPPIPAGQAVEMVTTYTVSNPSLGLLWTTETAAWPGRPAQIHTQGQPETNSYWFPCHDFPNEKLTSELIVTVPAGYEVCSNGRLDAKTRVIRNTESSAGVGMKPYDMFRWVQAKPHVNYLVSMVVGKFDIEDVGTKTLSMPVYVPQGRGKDIRGTYGRTGDMVEFYSRLLDEPYPWDKYAQLVVWNFGAGGMENTSATTMFDTAIIAKDDLDDFDLDGLISHELAHQWFGDLLTCNGWEYIWLNEGFATYMTELWFEHRDGKDAYQQVMIRNFDSVIGADRGVVPGGVAMASDVYSHPWEVFRKAANPYSKGASTLHMLRVTLGDQPFFSGIQAYVEKNKYQLVENSDLRSALEEASGRSLEHFFEQWTRRPGIPRATVELSWDAATGSLSATLEQTQTIDGDNPAFEFELPVVVVSESGETSRLALPVQGKSAQQSWTLSAEPRIVAVDPDLSVLGEFTISQPEARWISQINSGPTAASRVQAARALGRETSTRTAEVLRIVAGDRNQPWFVRSEAVRALGARGAEGDVRSLFTGVIDRWELREATTNALVVVCSNEERMADTELRARVAEQLSQRAGNDSSAKVRAAAIRAIGSLKLTEAFPAIRAAMKSESQEDILRFTSVEAIASMKPAKATDMLLDLAKPGKYSRTRAAAVEKIPSVVSSDSDRSKAFDFLILALNDAEIRTRRAAGDALVALGDPRAIPELERLKAAAPTGELADSFGKWMKQLQDKAANGQ